MKELIQELIIKNYIRNNGKVVDKAILGLLLKEKPELKQDIPDTLNSINSQIKQFLEQDSSKILEQVKAVEPNFGKEKKEDSKKKEKQMIEVPGLEKGKVVTRLAPEPSKYNHFGHALSFLINYLYAKNYEGKSILRFEDTNPANASTEFVESMKEDLLNYIGIEPHDVVYVSDHMETFYEYAEKLIEQGHAYMDFSTQEEIKEQRANLTGSKYRDTDSKTNIIEWKKFISGDYEPGICTLRLKIKPDHENEVMRDPVIFRIIKHKHWRHSDKYVAWPLYDFENAIEDGLMKITHVFRDNGFGKKRIELQDYIRSLFDLPNPRVVQYGRFNIKGGVSKGRDIREMIDSGEYTGWDDPRLITLRALKRRGIKPECFEKLVAQVGLSPTPTNLDFRNLSAINRQILDPISGKLFYIDQAEKVTVNGAPEIHVRFDKFLEKNDQSREFHTNEEFFICKKDYDEIKDGQMVRFIDTLNAIAKRKDGKLSFEFHSTDFKEYVACKNKGAKIHFVAPNQYFECRMVNEDASVTEGLIEKAAFHLKQDEIIQAERFGFVKYEGRIDEKMQFIFCHK